MQSQQAQGPTKPNSDTQEPAPKGQRNLPNQRRGVGNSVRPANQNGRRTSPDIKRYDNQFLTMIETLLDEEYNTITVDKDTKEKEAVIDESGK